MWMTSGDPKIPENGKISRRGVAASRKNDWISRHLRQVYDEALNEDIPADMLALLGKLDEPSSREGGA
jgi:hypothetical protein